MLSSPDGIGWDQRGKRFVLAPFAGPSVQTWHIGDPGPRDVATGKGMFDGVEAEPNGQVLITSWNDSSVSTLEGSKLVPRISKLPYQPADVSMDVGRSRVGIVSLVANRFELWEWPIEQMIGAHAHSYHRGALTSCTHISPNARSLSTARRRTLRGGVREERHACRCRHHREGCRCARRTRAPATTEGSTLPPGFCATVFADSLGHVRHLVVAANGDVYANTWSGKYYDEGSTPSSPFLVAMRDSNHDGRADMIKRFGDSLASGGAGGTGIALYKGGLFAEAKDKIVRYALDSAFAPAGAPVRRS